MREGQLALDPARRLDVGEHVGAAKAIDGLLRVAHHHEGAVVGAGRVDALEDVRLQAIRVLEFVDQGTRVAPADAFGEQVAAVCREGAMQFREQVVEAQAAVFPGAAGEALAGVFEHAPALEAQPRRAQFVNLAGRGGQVLEAVGHGAVRKLLGRSPQQQPTEIRRRQIHGGCKRQRFANAPFEDGAGLLAQVLDLRHAALAEAQLA